MNQGIMSATDLDTEDDTLDDTPTPSPQIDRGALLTPSPSPSPPAGPSRVVRCLLSKTFPH